MATPLFFFILLKSAHGYKNATVTGGDNSWINEARARQLEGVSGNLIINNAITDDWGFWLSTAENVGWGFDQDLPSRLILTLYGQTISTNNCDMLISFKDPYFPKYVSMNVQLDGSGENIIGPACDSIQNSFTPFFVGNNYYNSVYWAMTYTMPVSRKCRPFYVNNHTQCQYDTIATDATDTNSWPLRFMIDNNPINGTTVITFAANGVEPISCGFADSFTHESGLNIYISASELAQNYVISEFKFEYYLISDAPTMAPTKYPTNNPTITPTKNPTIAPTIAPTKNPTENPTKYPVNVPTNSPLFHLTTNPTNILTKTPTDSPLLYTLTTAELNEGSVTEENDLRNTKSEEKIKQRNDDILLTIIVVIIGLILLPCVALMLYRRRFKQRRCQQSTDGISLGERIETQQMRTGNNMQNPEGMSTITRVVSTDLSVSTEETPSSNKQTLGNGENLMSCDEFEVMIEDASQVNTIGNDGNVSINNDIVIEDDETVTEGQSNNMDIDDFVICGDTIANEQT